MWDEDEAVSLKVENVPGVIELDRQCWSCSNKPEKRPACGFCNGKGFFLTEAGEQVLRFMKRWS